MRYRHRDNVALATGLGLAGTAGLGWTAGAWLEAGARYPLQAAVSFVVIMAAAAGTADAPHPHPRFGAANVVTTVRAVLAALVAGLVGEPVTPGVLWVAIGVTAVIAALDGLDGWLARRARMASAFGARFDMETDAFLILVLSILVWQHGKAGAWVLACGAMRYGFVAAGWILPWLARPLAPTRRGKIVAVGQFLGLGVALAPVVAPPVSGVIAFAAVAALSWSFAIDIRRLSA